MGFFLSEVMVLFYTYACSRRKGITEVVPKSRKLMLCSVSLPASGMRTQICHSLRSAGFHQIMLPVHVK
jgi:hypothetical protein